MKRRNVRKLRRDQAVEDITLMYSKKVNNTTITSDKKTRKVDHDKIKKVVDSLITLGKIKYFKDLQLKNNCNDWINSILSTYPNVNERDVKELLNDFSDDMNTRMRTEEKYALFIITSDFIILCHSIFGEETITPKWDVIDRMLDKDNVLRYVYFKKENGNVKVIYYEENPSIFFANWLGIPEREAFEYLGGKNKICGDINGASFSLELTDEDFEKRFFQEKSFKIQDNQLILPNPIQSIPLIMVKVGRRPYKDINDFIQDFLAKRYDLSYYQEQYSHLNSTLNFDLLAKKLIDDKMEVKNSDNKILIKKSNTNFHIIFANDNIEIRPSFLSEIKTRLVNNEILRIFHAGGKVSPTPLKIKNLELYNELKSKSASIVLSYYNGLQIKDHFENIFLYVIFRLLAIENKETQIHAFLSKFAHKLLTDTCSLNSFANQEDKTMELKASDFVSGDNDSIIENLSKDITTKLKESSVKIYILGANEHTKEFEPLSISKFSDNRVADLETKLKQELNNDKIKFVKVPTNEGKECILIMLVGCLDVTKIKEKTN